MRSVFTAFLLFVNVAGLFSCTGSSSREQPAIDQRAYRAWKLNEAIFETALNGHQKNDDFEQSCRFFESLTGIKIHLHFFTLGVLPTLETRNDLDKIRSWYGKNKYRLYWDEGTSSVKLRSDLSPAMLSN